MKNLTILWLDDERDPEVYLKQKSNSGAFLRTSEFYKKNIFNKYDVSFIWCRNYDEFTKHIEKNGLKVLGEEYYPLGHTQFNSVINKIKLKKPDVIFSIVVGGSNVAFYKQLKAAGIDLKKEKPMLLSTSVTEDEVLGIGGENYEGAYTFLRNGRRTQRCRQSDKRRA